MSEIQYPRKRFQTSRGYTYSYIHIPSSSAAASDPDQNPDQSHVLLLHGFPSIAVDFAAQIDYLSSLGHGIIAPDLIGYGASSRPRDPEAYKHKLIVQDLIELLDEHNCQTVVGISHDFGAQILTRLEFYHPDRVRKLAFLTVGPVTLGQEFNLDAVNAMTLKMLGYEGFGYQEFLTRDTDATTLLEERSQSFHDLVFTSEHDLWKDYFGRVGGLKQWLTEDRRCDVIDGFRGESVRAHEEAFAGRNGGYEGAKGWYIGFVNNLNITDDRSRLDELGVEHYQLPRGKKVLLVTAKQDVIAFPDAQEQMTRPYVSDPSSDLIVEGVEAGHWIGIERADEVNNLLKKLLDS